MYIFIILSNIVHRKKLLNTERLSIIKKFINAKDLENARVKKLEYMKVRFIKSTYLIIVYLVYLTFNFHAGVWRFSNYLISVLIGEFEYYEIFKSIVFIIIYRFICSILDLGFHCLEFSMLKRSRYPNETFINFISVSQFLSWIKKTLLYIFFASMLMLVHEDGYYNFYYFCLYIYACIVVYMIIVTFFMKPSSKNFELLTDGELKDQLEYLAERVNFPLDKIFLTSHSLTDPKAKCTSIGFITQTFYSRSIVLYKDAIKRNSVEEVCALVSSKLAHCKLNFKLKEFALGKVYLFCIVYLFITLSHNQNLIKEFGLDNIPIVVYFALYSHITVPMNYTFILLLSLVKVRHIFKADSIAKSLGYKKPLEQGLIKLNEESLNYFNTNKHCGILRSAEPTVVARLNALNDPNEEELANFY